MKKDWKEDGWRKVKKKKGNKEKKNRREDEENDRREKGKNREIWRLS